MEENITKDRIIEVMKYVKENSFPDTIFCTSQTNLIFDLLCARYIDGKRSVLLNKSRIPGKTILNVMMNKCMRILDGEEKQI